MHEERVTNSGSDFIRKLKWGADNQHRKASYGNRCMAVHLYKKLEEIPHVIIPIIFTWC